MTARFLATPLSSITYEIVKIHLQTGLRANISMYTIFDKHSKAGLASMTKTLGGFKT